MDRLKVFRLHAVPGDPRIAVGPQRHVSDQVLDEQQIAGKERCARIVEDRQVVVGMSRRPCFQGQYTAAEIDLYFVVDKQRWRYDFYVVDEPKTQADFDRLGIVSSRLKAMNSQ